MDVQIKQEQKLTGTLSIKHRTMLWAFGEILIWIGKAFQNVRTYEEVEKLIDEGGEAAQKFKKFEENYREDMDSLGEYVETKFKLNE